MLKTKNDIASANRGKLIELINARLADCIDLSTQVKVAHWNVRGPHFIGLHELFDKIYADVVEAIDLIAERAGQLGGLALGTARQVAKASTLPEYPADIVSGKDHVRALSTALASFGKDVRAAIDQAEDLDDKDTADMFTEISRDVDKNTWFVEAHLQADE